MAAAGGWRAHAQTIARAARPPQEGGGRRELGIKGNVSCSTQDSSSLFKGVRVKRLGSGGEGTQETIKKEGPCKKKKTVFMP